ncbi:PleD family two-component system response regulator [Thiohalocapsa sp. ML1]|uniref:response regulator n=1 Tax=Thiohalocapsa sp. ML1 TaxID=1431688 RepID=UPI00073225A1|nr:response regulator [Thiohalocapsa sp. ML1]
MSGPDAADADAAAPPPAAGDRVPRGSAADARTALIIDDDPVLRLTIARFIEKLGFATRLCADGAAGVGSVRAERPDIVLLDAAMPQMDGFAACQAIRDLPAGANLPIIMITGFNDEASVDRAFAVGANEYITKPVHWAVLRHRVCQLVAAARAEQALRDDRAFLQSLVDAVPAPTIVCNVRSIFFNRNNAYRRPVTPDADYRRAARTRFALPALSHRNFVYTVSVREPSKPRRSVSGIWCR